MKTRFLRGGLCVLIAASALMTSCYDDLELRQEIEGLGNEVEQIKNDVAQLKSDLATLKNAVDGNLSIVKLNDLPDGYELVFSDGSKAVIKNGVNGKDGKDATAPVVSVAEDEGGNLYWTINGEWLLDEDGNKVKASAEDGAEGAAGEAGKTPEVSIALDETDGYYYWKLDGEWILDNKGNRVRANGIDAKNPEISVVYSESNGMWLWLVNGKYLTGADGGLISAQGPAGIDGLNGDAFFKSVELSKDGTMLVITLINKEDEDGEDIVYEIPMGVFNIMFTKMDETGVTSELKKFEYTISGASADDEVIVRVLSTNAQKYNIVPDASSNAKGHIEVEPR